MFPWTPSILNKIHYNCTKKQTYNVVANILFNIHRIRISLYGLNTIDISIHLLAHLGPFLSKNNNMDKYSDKNNYIADIERSFTFFSLYLRV